MASSRSPKRSRVRDTIADLTAAQRVGVAGILICLGFRLTLEVDLEAYIGAFGAIFAAGSLSKADRETR